MAETPLATVAILTYNGELYLERILAAVFEQKVDGAVEVLVIDSGSTDSTLEIIGRFPDVRLHTIPNSEFGHGRTRNLAATLARGTFIAYLTHDAIPLDSHWLREMLAPFEISRKVVAVLGRQTPRANCFPLQKYDISELFASLGSAVATSLFSLDTSTQTQQSLDTLGFFSDVNSASRRSFLTDVIRYRDVPYAEDQLFGADLISAGYTKAYAAKAAVEHSNDLSFREFGKRIFDETVGLRRIGFEIRPLGRKAAARMALGGALRDTMRIIRDGQYSRKRKLFWVVVNPAYHVQKWRIYRRATLVDLDNLSAIAAGSLEHSRKKG